MPFPLMDGVIQEEGLYVYNIHKIVLKHYSICCELGIKWTVFKWN
jgi:hypothetical protein